MLATTPSFSHGFLGSNSGHQACAARLSHLTGPRKAHADGVLALSRRQGETACEDNGLQELHLRADSWSTSASHPVKALYLS